MSGDSHNDTAPNHMSSKFKLQVAQLAERGNKPEEWHDYIKTVQCKIGHYDEPKQKAMLDLLYVTAFKVIPATTKTLAYASLVISCAQYKSKYCVAEAEKLLLYARRTLGRFTIVHIASAEFELERDNKDKAIRILQKAIMAGIGNQEMLELAMQRAREGRIPLLSDETKENKAGVELSPEAGRETSLELSNSHLSGHTGENSSLDLMKLTLSQPSNRPPTQEVQQCFELLSHQQHGKPAACAVPMDKNSHQAILSKSSEKQDSPYLHESKSCHNASSCSSLLSSSFFGPPHLSNAYSSCTSSSSSSSEGATSSLPDVSMSSVFNSSNANASSLPPMSSHKSPKRLRPSCSAGRIPQPPSSPEPSNHASTPLFKTPSPPKILLDMFSNGLRQLKTASGSSQHSENEPATKNPASSVRRPLATLLQIPEEPAVPVEHSYQACYQPPTSAKKGLRKFNSTPSMSAVKSVGQGSAINESMRKRLPRRVKVDPTNKALWNTEGEDIGDITVSAFELLAEHSDQSQKATCVDGFDQSQLHRDSSMAQDFGGHEEDYRGTLTGSNTFFNHLIRKGNIDFESNQQDKVQAVIRSKGEHLNQNFLADQSTEGAKSTPSCGGITQSSHAGSIMSCHSKCSSADLQKGMDITSSNKLNSNLAAVINDPVLTKASHVAGAPLSSDQNRLVARREEPLTSDKNKQDSQQQKLLVLHQQHQLQLQQQQLEQQKRQQELLQQQLEQQKLQQQQQQMMPPVKHAGLGNQTYSVHSQNPASVPYVTPAKQVTEIGQKIIHVNSHPYTVIRLVGRGGSAKVYQVCDSSSKRICALKVVNLSFSNATIRQGYMNEVALLKKLQACDPVIRLFDSEYNEETQKLLLVLEYGEIDLNGFISKSAANKQLMPPSKVFYFWLQMVTAVHAMHREGVIHSDLKPPNFLLVAGEVKLIDFGIANAVQQDSTSILKDITVGTPSYMSPEMLVANRTCSEGSKRLYKVGMRSDVWSLGCILYQMVYGHTPFQHVHNKIEAIINPNHQIVFPPRDDPALMDVLKKCLQRDVNLRPTTEELLRHPYLQMNRSAVPRPAPALESSADTACDTGDSSVSRLPNAPPSLASKLSLLETVFSAASPRTKEALGHRLKELSTGIDSGGETL